jgi:hypothetical protein
VRGTTFLDHGSIDFELNDVLANGPERPGAGTSASAARSRAAEGSITHRGSFAQKAIAPIPALWRVNRACANHHRGHQAE